MPFNNLSHLCWKLAGALYILIRSSLISNIAEIISFINNVLDQPDRVDNRGIIYSHSRYYSLDSLSPKDETNWK